MADSGARRISWSQDIATVTHPRLWVMRTYLQTDGILLSPASDDGAEASKRLLGEFPEEGWHADYPYHPDVYPDDRWRDETVYGVQFNLCIDDFTVSAPNMCRAHPRAAGPRGLSTKAAPGWALRRMMK